MPIQVECSSCRQIIKAKEEFAGRRIRCPSCQTPMTLPDVDVDEDIEEPELELPPPKRKSDSRSRIKTSGSRSSGKPWFLRHWQWLAVLLVLVIAPFSLFAAGIAAFAGALMILIGGVTPFLRILFGDPGTVLLMIVSRSARFDMMRRPDNHPYKVLCRNAFNPTRGLFWRGVLLLISFIPAAFLHGFAGPLLRRRGGGGGHNVAPFGAPGGPPGGVTPSVHRTAANSGFDRTYYVKLTYTAFTGAGSLVDAVKSALAEIPSTIADSVQVDEPSMTIRFQHRGPVDHVRLSMQMQRRGVALNQLNSGISPQ
jgi:hypothetical protein